MSSSKPDKRGPLKEDLFMPCRACDRLIVAGEFFSMISLGPGDDEEARERCRKGRPYDAVELVVHWECATGGEG